MVDRRNFLTLPLPSLNGARVARVSRRAALSLASAALAGFVVKLRPAAAVTVDITQANPQPMPIAIPDFLGGVPGDNETAQGVSQIISANLKRSGLFAPIDPAAFLEKISSVDAVPHFADWRTINAQALATGRVTRQADGRLKAEFRLWDVLAGQQLAGQQYYTTPDNWRRIAHIISDAIYERLTGEKGYFDSRVVFVDETGPAERRIKRLAIMDQDGANVRYLTRGDDLVPVSYTHLLGRMAVCAEAVALGRAVVDLGDAGIDTIVAVRHPPPGEKDQTIAVVSPCGACRELIFDYDPKARVIVPNGTAPSVVAIGELLPNKYSRGSEE